jgi:hypothetical protein
VKTTPVREPLYPAHHTWNLVPTGLLSQASISAPVFASSDQVLPPLRLLNYMPPTLE